MTANTLRNRAVITASGLAAPSKIHLQASTVYYIGASTSPERIIVTRVTERLVQFVALSGEREPQRMERWVAEHLIAQGSKTHHDNLRGRLQHWEESYPEHAESMRASLEPEIHRLALLLAGEPVETDDPRKFDRMIARVVFLNPDPAVDEWREAEQYGSVAGFDHDGRMAYQIRGERERVEGVQTDPRFGILSYDEESPSKNVQIP